jgi:nicotinate-nucleotide pyrophosphorylase (carboxylating)
MSLVDFFFFQRCSLRFAAFRHNQMATSEEPAPLQLDGLLPDLSSYVQLWLSQDIPSFDVQGCVAGSKRVTAHLLQKSPCILAGRPFFDAVFAQLGCSVDWHAAEGSVHSSEGNRHVATVSGPAHAVLKGERTALELIVRCSGVATLASRYAAAAAAGGWKGRVAGTRKVAPGLRLVDKCVRCRCMLLRCRLTATAAGTDF